MSLNSLQVTSYRAEYLAMNTYSTKNGKTRVYFVCCYDHESYGSLSPPSGYYWPHLAHLYSDIHLRCRLSWYTGHTSGLSLPNSQRAGRGTCLPQNQQGQQWNSLVYIERYEMAPLPSNRNTAAFAPVDEALVCARADVALDPLDNSILYSCWPVAVD